MQNNIFKIFVSVSALLLLTTGCKDYLQLTPKSDLVQEEFWQNQDQVEAAVAGCYASMNESGFTERVLLFGEVRAEMLTSVRASGNTNNMMKNYLISTNGWVNWSNFYKTINFCNTVLAFADQAYEKDATFSEIDLKRYKAEVLSIRSLVYFILVKNYKEVPLILEATLSDQSDFYPAKSSEQEVIDQIIKDLKTAVEDLRLTNPESLKHDKGRFTKGAANALLADVYLWNDQYDNCIDACQEIISSEKYALVDGTEWFNSIFFLGNSKEGIFELQFDDINATLQSNFYAVNPTLAPLGTIATLYEDNLNDVRANRATYDLETGTAFKYAGVDAKSGLFRGNTEFYNTWIFYRYAEVLLMQAEAYALSDTRKDLTKAKALVNQVYMRATGVPLDIPESESGILDAILTERQKEFAFEGKRWYDLLRYARRDGFEQQQLILDLVDIKATADNYVEIESYYSDTASYWLPIYLNELNLNHNLEQNPYYN